MAKGRHKRKDKRDDSPTTSQTVRMKPAKTLVAIAYQSWDRGDVVTARKAALLGLSRPALSTGDEDDAREYAKTLFDDGKPRDAKQVLEEILSRTRVEPKPYVFAGVAAAIIVLMIVLAVVRS